MFIRRLMDQISGLPTASPPETAVRKSPEVTVITPAYNTARWLPDCLKSVAGQTGVTLEHLVIDDGSTDGTAQLLAAQAARFTHIRVLTQDGNQGQARARNLALDQARGDYVVFLDSDDRLHDPAALRTAIDRARATQSDVLHCQYARFNDGTDDLRPAVNRLTGHEISGTRAEAFPQAMNITSCWQMVFRRDFLETHGLRFDHQLRQREDRPFVTDCLLRARNIATSQVCLIDYRIRADSTMRRLDLDQLDLFSRHLEAVGGQMNGLANGAGFADLRRANLLYYMNAVLSYWRAFLLRPEVWDSPQVDRFLAVWRDHGWAAPELWQDRALGNVNEDHRDSGFFDVLAFALSRAEKSTVRNLLLKERISLSQMERLGVLQDNGAGPFILTDLAFNRFCTSNRLRRPQTSTNDNLPDDLPIVLHAGMTKTGSSSLQKFFEINRFRLLRDQGLYYPLTGVETGRGVRLHRTSGHAQLVEQLLRSGEEAREALAIEVAQLITTPQRLMLSCENILSARFWDKGAVVAELAAAFGDHPVTVMIYLRDQVDWLESMYRESVTSPGIRYVDGIETFRQEQDEQGLLDHSAIAASFAQHWPKARLILRSYDAATDVIEDAGAVLGLPADAMARYGRPDGLLRNPTAQRRAVQLIRAANRIAVPRDRVATLNDTIAQVAARQDGGPRRYFISGEQAVAERSRHATANQAFWAVHHPEAARLSPPDAPRPSVEQGEILTAWQLDAFTEALALALSGPVAGISNGPLPPEERDEPQDHLQRLWITEARAELVPLPDAALKQKLDEAEVILESDLFDSLHYLAQYPQAAVYPGGALAHYIDSWGKLYLDPNRGFSTRDYLVINKDVAEARVNPFVHYIQYGRAEGRLTVLDI